MKRVFLLSFVVAAIAILSSCASSRVSCPTYADSQEQVENTQQARM